MRPHVEKNFAKILKIGRVIAIFVPLTKILKQVKKSRKGVFLDTQKSYFIQIFKPGQHVIIFRFHLLYQPIDTQYFFRVLNFFRGAKMGVPPKILTFFCFSLLLIH